MKKIIEEYGKILSYVIVGIVVLGSVITGIQSWYENTYPELELYEGIYAVDTSDEPVLLVENIEINSQDEWKEIDFTQYVTAYENGSKAVELSVDIFGTDEVDITQKGIYQIICSVTNDAGLSFTKRVPVLIY